MRAVVAWTTYPLLLGGGMALGTFAMERGHPAWLVVGVLGVAAMIVVAILERALPFVPEWNRTRGDVTADAMHLVVSNTAMSQLVNITILALIASAAPELAKLVGAPLWPAAWPLVAQVALACAIGELGLYWSHRLLHERPLLWRLHIVHHSAERLYWLNGFRNHPFDAPLQYAAMQIPLILLGASAEAITLVALLQVLHTPLQHSNIAVRTGALCYLVSTAELHRWHHAPGIAANVNYGTMLSVWDLVFGTFYRPGDECSRVGLEEGTRVPRRYLDQLMVPFRWPPR